MENNTVFKRIQKRFETIKSAEVIKEKEIKKTVNQTRNFKTKKVNKKNDKKPIKNKPLKSRHK